MVKLKYGSHEMEMRRMRYLLDVSLCLMGQDNIDIPFAVLDVDDSQWRDRVIRLTTTTIDEDGIGVPVKAPKL